MNMDVEGQAELVVLKEMMCNNVLDAEQQHIL